MIVVICGASSNANVVEPCAECQEPIGDNPCIILIDKDNVHTWYCMNCIKVKLYGYILFPCSK